MVASCSVQDPCESRGLRHPKPLWRAHRTLGEGPSHHRADLRRQDRPLKSAGTLDGKSCSEANPLGPWLAFTGIFFQVGALTSFIKRYLANIYIYIYINPKKGSGSLELTTCGLGLLLVVH